jgi:hypothetical protein
MIVQSESIQALAKALAEAQGEIENAHKNAKNPHFKSDYADLAEIINTVRPVLSRHGLAVIQMPGYVDGVVTVDTLLTHSSGEWVRGTSGAPLQKQDPQGVGSACTYLRRYSLSALCNIAQEDDDGERSVVRQPRQDPVAAMATASMDVPATSAQLGLIATMSESHVITEKERDGLARRMSSGMTKDDAKKALDWLKTELRMRKAIEAEEAAQAEQEALI